MLEKKLMKTCKLASLIFALATSSSTYATVTEHLPETVDILGTHPVAVETNVTVTASSITASPMLTATAVSTDQLNHHHTIATLTNTGVTIGDSKDTFATMCLKNSDWSLNTTGSNSEHDNVEFIVHGDGAVKSASTDVVCSDAVNGSEFENTTFAYRGTTLTGGTYILAGTVNYYLK